MKTYKINHIKLEDGDGKVEIDLFESGIAISVDANEGSFSVKQIRNLPLYVNGEQLDRETQPFYTGDVSWFVCGIEDGNQ